MSRYFAVGSCLVLAGCLGSDRIAAPQFDVAASAEGAIAAYDKDSNGSLDKAECKGSPFELTRWDGNSDGKVSTDEIQTRLERYEQQKTGITGVVCAVTWNRRPLENAKVVFEPEEFLGGAIEAAEATTDIEGQAMPAIPEVVAKDPVLTGVRPGLYKIRITHPDIDIPAKYNTESTLSFDASPIDVLGTVHLNLRK